VAYDPKKLGARAVAVAAGEEQPEFMWKCKVADLCEGAASHFDFLVKATGRVVNDNNIAHFKNQHK
jgi:hypothetical protein